MPAVSLEIKFMGINITGALPGGSRWISGRTLNFESPACRIPFAAFSKLGYFGSLHDAPVTQIYK